MDCNDAMFSGHTCLYSLVRNVNAELHATLGQGCVGRKISLCCCTLCCVVSVATRGHYTTDVLVVVYVSDPICMHRAAAIRALMLGEDDVGGIITGESERGETHLLESIAGGSVRLQW